MKNIDICNRGAEAVGEGRMIREDSTLFFYLKDASMQTVESTTNIKKEGEEEKRGERDQSMQVCRGDGAREKEIERERVMGAGSEAKQRRRGREV